MLSIGANTAFGSTADGDPAEAAGAQADRHAVIIPPNANTLGIFFGNICPSLSVNRPTSFDSETVVSADPSKPLCSSSPKRRSSRAKPYDLGLQISYCVYSKVPP